VKTAPARVTALEFAAPGSGPPSAVDAATAMREKYRWMFPAPQWDGPGKKGIRAIAPDNTSTYGYITEAGAVHLIGGPLIETLSPDYYADLDLLFKPNPTPVRAERIGDRVRLSMAGGGPLRGKYYLTSGDTRYAVAISAPPEAPDPPLSFVVAKPPAVEQVGLPAARVHFQALREQALQRDQSGRWHWLAWSRSEKKGPCLFSDLCLDDGSVRQRTIPAEELTLAVRSSDGRTYFGAYNSPFLVEYDLDARVSIRSWVAFQDPTQTVFSMRAGPLGSIAIGGTKGATALFLPSTGVIEQGTYGGLYSYSVAYDGLDLHTAVRDEGRWRWHVRGFGTGADRLVKEFPGDGFFQVSYEPDATSVFATWDVAGNRTTYQLGNDGRPIEVPTPQALTSDPPPPAPSIELETALDGGGVTARWAGKSALIPCAPEPQATRDVCLVGKRLIGVSQGYGTVSSTDPETGQGEYLLLDPDDSISTLCPLGSGLVAFGAYPSASLGFFIAGQGEVVGRRRTIEHGQGDLIGIVREPNGDLTTVGIETRYGSAIRVGRYAGGTYAPETYPELDHLGPSWVCSADGGRLAVIATHLKPNPALSSPVPREARILFLGTESRTLASHVLLPGVDNYGQICEVPGGLLGLSYDLSNPSRPRTLLWLWDLTRGVLVRQTAVAGILGGGKAGKETGLPRVGPGFVLGPDGKVWTASAGPGTEAKTIHRIDPASLSVEPVAVLSGAGWPRFAFAGGWCYFTGWEKLGRMRVPGAL
jgi:hypothetical protein